VGLFGAEGFFVVCLNPSNAFCATATGSDILQTSGWGLVSSITGRISACIPYHSRPCCLLLLLLVLLLLQMVATEDIPKGAEVVNCYGTLSNAELLRGYGYVEQHNGIKHVQVPAHFCIKAAAAAAEAAGATGKAPASRKGRESGKHGSAAAGAEDDGVSDGVIDDDGHQEACGADSDSEGPSGGDSGDSDEDDESPEGDDESSSSEGSESEPDWDLEDDSSEELQEQQQRQQQYWAQQQQQQGHKGQATDKRSKKKQKLSGKQQQQQQQMVTVPSLAEAQAHISDWEERWQLCFSLGLLPKNGVFQVPAGGLSSCPGQLLAVLLLFLLDAADCAALAAALVDATRAAAAAAAAPKHKSSGRKQQHTADKQGRSKRCSGEGEATGDAPQPEAAVSSTPEEQQLPPMKVGASQQYLILPET